MARISGKDIQEIRQKAGAPLYNAFVEFGKQAVSRWDAYTREMIRLRSAQLANCQH